MCLTTKNNVKSTFASVEHYYGLENGMTDSWKVKVGKGGKHSSPEQIHAFIQAKWQQLHCWHVYTHTHTYSQALSLAFWHIVIHVQCSNPSWSMLGPLHKLVWHVNEMSESLNLWHTPVRIQGQKQFNHFRFFSLLNVSHISGLFSIYKTITRLDQSIQMHMKNVQWNLT